MAILNLEPVNTNTTGGFEAQISGIDPTDSDCLVGTVLTVGLGRKKVRWDLGGRCRDNHDSLNLDMRNDKMLDLRETAKRLGAPT